MELRSAFAITLQGLRSQLDLSQEDFSVVSSRTNISLLERGKTIPTLEKLTQICTVLKLHPLTVMTLCYSKLDDMPADELLKRVTTELQFLVTLDQD
ncbi:helix-turn-helix domain-containing protein [Pseudomonas bohemica]|uniref:helix-turn-helix domain-containing protein n=1 Tax=Pseudomonas bohemica TaxID=2044872 RepID=UPI000DA5ECE7|nr:helix-turn-helix transcriptional regulator [Pseudomonas bohemica]